MPNPLLDIASLAARILPMPLKQFIYRLGPLARFVRGSLNKAAPSGLAQVKVATGELADATLLLDLQAEKDYWLATYEPELVQALRKWLGPGMVVFDVGANIGYIALIMARLVGETGHIYAFEALPANVDRLRNNIALNDLTTRVTIYEGAVTAGKGPVGFLVHSSGGMGKAEGSAGREDEYNSRVSVPGISLDDYVYKQRNRSPQVIKMDIEGGEVLALQGMRHLLNEARPLLLLELHGPEAAQAAWEKLVAAGYELCEMKRGYRRLLSAQALDWKAYVVARPLPAEARHAA